MPEQDAPAATHPGCTRHLPAEQGGDYCEACDVLAEIERFRATCTRWHGSTPCTVEESEAGFELHDLGLQLVVKLEAAIVAGRVGGK